jgi:chromosomal replication initiation ATPase DnaA
MNLTHSTIRGKLKAWETELQGLLSDNIRLIVVPVPEGEYVAFDTIKSVVCKVTGIPFQKVLHPSKEAEIVQARHLISFYAIAYSGLSLQKIGVRIGGKHHTTVRNGVQRIKDLLESNDMKITELVGKINHSLNLYS